MGENGKTVQVLRRNAALALEGPPAAWLVETGMVALMRARLENGAPAGPRRYLFTCRPGTLLLRLEPGALDDGHGLLALGLEDAALREASLAESAALEDWVISLSSTVFTGVPPAGVPHHETLTLAAGDQLRGPERGVIWLQVESGTLRLAGVEELQIGPGEGPLPLAGRAWVAAEGQATVRLRHTEEISDVAGRMRGLALLHRLCFRHLRRLEEAEQRAEAERLDTRTRLQAIDTGEALDSLGSVLSGGEATPRRDTDLLTALALVGRQLGVAFQPAAASEDVARLSDPLEAVARSSGVRMRSLQLRGRWWQSDGGALLGYLQEDQRPVALLRTASYGYELFDPRDGSRRAVDESVDALLSRDAVMFYPPFPPEVRGLPDLMRLVSRTFRREMLLVSTVSLLGTVLAMLIPQATRMIIDDAIPDADTSLIAQMALALFAVACGQAGFLLAQGVVMLRVQTAATSMLQAATWDRLLRLPTRFFRGYSTGDLMNRSMMITELSQELSATALRTLVTGAMSLLNVGLLFYYSAKLALVALLIGLVACVVTTSLSALLRKAALDLERDSGRLFGFAVQLLTGVAKLRVAGAEQRAYNQWARRYAGQLRLTARVQELQDVNVLFNYVVPLFSALVIFFAAGATLGAAAAPGGEAAGPLSTGAFLAFNAALGVFLTGATSVSTTLVTIMGSLAKSKLIQPLLTTEPEVGPGKVDPGRLRGGLALRNVTFRYRSEGVPVLHQVNLHADPGEFVALVGPSGSGKSTVLRLLLGFEIPESGSVLFDGRDLASLDVTAVRRQAGVVLQMAKIGATSILAYLTAGTRLTLEEAWQAARDAGLAEDIESMPMGMHTIISEGGGNLSGGQRQRLIIARALALNPRILLFDEATSALDNRTQAVVSESLRRRNVTRLTIAHRLSTIRHADRIYVLEAGRVIQAGTFDELAVQDGLFRRMMARQMT